MTSMENQQYIVVRDIAMPELALYREHSENRLYHWNEPAPGYFVSESPNVIQRALQAGFEPMSFLMEEYEVGLEVNRFVEEYPEAPVYVCKKEELREIIGYGMTRGLLAVMKRREPPKADEIMKTASRVAVLEDVTNPTNVGAIFRSAAALHMDAVLLTGDCSDPYYRRASRVSMGTVFQVPWGWLEKDWQKQLQEQGFLTAAMALREDAIRLGEKDFQTVDKLAVLMGNEGEGLKDETIRNANFCVMIPMSHGVDSLNVAAASAVAFWEMRKS